MNVVVLMAGDSKEFLKDGSKYPKFLYEISGKPLVQYVVENLAPVATNFIFLINKDDAQKWHLESVIKLLVPEAKVLIVEGSTRGAACSALYATEFINNDEELLIANGDQLIDSDLKEDISKLKNYDGGTLIFESVHPRWSYVKLDEQGSIIQASEKRPISKHATAGVYYFKKGRYFVNGASSMIQKDASVNGNFFVCPVFNEMILDHLKLGTAPIEREQYHSLTSVQSVKNYINYLKDGEHHE